jgi:hypothetical protein
MCTDGVNSYTCTCQPGYTGTNCQTNINECSPNPCQNGGSCTDGVNSYTCNCVGGYTGTNCQTAPAPTFCDVVYRLTADFRVADPPTLGSPFTVAVGTNTANPSLNSGHTTPFTVASSFDNAFVRIRYPATGGNPVASSAEVIEYYMPLDFATTQTGTTVTTRVDHSVGLLGMTGNPPSIPVSPTLNRACISRGSGTFSGTVLNWAECSVVPPASGLGWSPDNAQAPNDPGCFNRMSVWGAVTCSGIGCFAVTTGEQRATWDQFFDSFTFSGSDLRTATFSTPEVQIPESTSETSTRTYIKIKSATPIHVECGEVAELTCD